MFNNYFNPLGSLKSNPDFNINNAFKFNATNFSPNQPINLPSSNIANVIKQQLALAEYCFNATFDGVERLVGLNISTVRNALEVTLSSINGIIADNKNNLNSNNVMVFLHPAIENSVEYTRKALEIGRETKSKLSDKLEQEFQNNSEKMSRFVERSFAYSPIGGKTASTAMKSAIQMANDAFNGLNKASDKINEVAQANVNAAVTVTGKTLDKINDFSTSKAVSENNANEIVEPANEQQTTITSLVATEGTKKTVAKRGRKSTN